MRVFLIDGTYELFRQYFGQPSHITESGQEVGAVRGVLRSMLSLIADGATHLGVATDHVIESFRNDMWDGYKTGEGIEPELFTQFPILEEGLDALGIYNWPMVELEADDALASAAAVAADDDRVEQVVVMTPDKDLAQVVRDGRIVQLDRRKTVVYDEAAVMAKFGVMPESIPDYLALVGDSADGFPGLPGWGAKSAGTVLAHYKHLEDIPASAGEWHVRVRGAPGLADTLAEQRDLALLFRELATLRVDRSLLKDVDELRWGEPSAALEQFATRIEAPDLITRARELRPS